MIRILDRLLEGPGFDSTSLDIISNLLEKELYSLTYILDNNLPLST